MQIAERVSPTLKNNPGTFSFTHVSRKIELKSITDHVEQASLEFREGSSTSLSVFVCVRECVYGGSLN